MKRDAGKEVPGSKILGRLVSARTNPSARAKRDEDAARWAEAMERLPQAQRDVLVMRFFDRLEFTEITRRTGKSDGAAGVNRESRQ